MEENLVCFLPLDAEDGDKEFILHISDPSDSDLVRKPKKIHIKLKKKTLYNLK
jgi:hypothetical protein